jgi:hypothetical protein
MLLGDRLQELDLDAGRIFLVRGARERPEPAVSAGHDAPHLLHPGHRIDVFQFVWNGGGREVAIAGLIEAVAERVEYLRLVVAKPWFAILSVDVIRFQFEYFCRECHGDGRGKHPRAHQRENARDEPSGSTAEKHAHEQASRESSDGGKTPGFTGQRFDPCRQLGHRRQDELEASCGRRPTIALSGRQKIMLSQIRPRR